MTETPNNKSEQKKLSGKLTMIIFLVLFPLLVVPALLTGKVYEKQICVHTLQQREATYWIIGSYAINEIDWEPINIWPEELQTEPALFSTFPQWPAESPSEYFDQMTAEETEHLWESTSRELALAFVLPVPNKKALLTPVKPVVAIRALMIKSLSESDRETYLKLNEMLKEDAPAEKVTRHGRIKSATDWDYKGQENAAAILTKVQNAWSQNGGDLSVDELREILINAAE